MRRPNRIHVVGSAVFAVTALGIAACTDLFHSTDFATICTIDASACPKDAEDDVDAKVSKPDSGPAAIDFCKDDEATAKQHAERACGWIGACVGSRENSSYSDCYVRALSAYDCTFNPSLRPLGKSAILWDCLAKVATCTAVNRCLFGSDDAPACTPQDPAGTFSACSANGVVGCDGTQAPTGMEPCALRGRTCTKVDLSTSICAGTLGTACGSGTPPFCKDKYAVQCHSAAGGITSDEGTDCSLVGAGRCVEDGADVACAPAAGAPECTTSAKITCSSGAVAESCVDGHTVQFACASLGQTCSVTNASSLDPLSACKARLTDEPCATAEDFCAGTQLKSCHAGTVFTLDCGNVLGLETCGTIAGRWAACKRR